MPFEKGHPPYYRRTASGAVLTLERAPEEKSSVIVSRFLLADVPARAEWLLGRLVEKWPHISEATFAGRLRAWIGSNSHYLVKTPHAIGLTRIARTELDPLPIGEEVFLFTADPKDRQYDREGIAIYRDTCRWVKSHGASKYIIKRQSDVDFDVGLRRELGVEEVIARFLPL